MNDELKELERISNYLLKDGFDEISLDKNNKFQAKAQGWVAVVSKYSNIKNLESGLNIEYGNHKKFYLNKMPIAKNDIVEVDYQPDMKIYYKDTIWEYGLC